MTFSVFSLSLLLQLNNCIHMIHILRICNYIKNMLRNKNNTTSYTFHLHTYIYIINQINYICIRHVIIHFINSAYNIIIIHL